MQSGLYHFIKQHKVEHSGQYHKVIEFIHMHMRDRNTWQEQANRLICINDFKWRKREAANYLRGKVFCVFSVAVSWSMLPIWKVENLFQFTLWYMDLKCLTKNTSLKMIYFDLFLDCACVSAASRILSLILREKRVSSWQKPRSSQNKGNNCLKIIFELH